MLENRTTVVFGSGAIDRLSSLLAQDARILLLYGGGSIKANGVYDAVMQALGERFVVPFGGIEPNPEYRTIMNAASVFHGNGLTFILGVGGGSVIDAAKFLAAAVRIDKGEAWNQLTGADRFEAVENGAVLTLPATGSESNSVSVISHAEHRLKLPFRNETTRPKFAILDPSTMRSLPLRQLENGVVDSVTHVLEQYLTVPVNAPIQHGYSETLLGVLFAWGPRLIAEQSDEARENVMWAANQALNGLIGAGVPQDWSTHMIGHALTALYGLDHARSLSLIMPHVMRHQIRGKQTMLTRYARRVWQLSEPDDYRAAEKAIDMTEDFFRRMNCPTRFSEVPGLVVDADDVIAHLTNARQLPLGEAADLGTKEIFSILQAAA